MRGSRAWGTSLGAHDYHHRVTHVPGLHCDPCLRTVPHRNRTRMRSPFVKGHTLPRKRMFCLVSAVQGWRSRNRGRVLTLFRAGCRGHVSAPHTSCGSSAAEMTSAAAPDRGLLDGLEPSLAPHAVLLKAAAERCASARAGQARERGRTHQPCWTLAAWQGAAAGVQSAQRDRGEAPTCPRAVGDAGA
jgi:hypothetical protein